MHSATIVSSSLLGHIIAVGTWLAGRGGPLGSRVLAWTAAYFLVVHILLALLLTAFPDLVDPR